MFKTTIKIGVFWDGPKYVLPPRRWFWLAWAFAKWELLKFPYRIAFVTKATS